jgi:hypothetical protein
VTIKYELKYELNTDNIISIFQYFNIIEIIKNNDNIYK